MKLEKEKIQEFIKPYINGKKHSCYTKMVDLSKKIYVHSDQEEAPELINTRRPSESDRISEYRKSIYTQVTKDSFDKIINSLSKIRRSSDWSIKYTSDKSGINELREYCETNFPIYSSITNWCFSELLKKYLIDPNSVCVISPLDFTFEDNELVEPIAHIYSSINVLDFVPESYCVIKDIEKSTYTISETKQQKEGSIYLLITEDFYYKIEQVSDNDYSITTAWQHNLEYLPVFRLKAVFKEKINKTVIYESRISGIVPRLNEAIREYSDMQAEVVQHIHSEKWIYAQQQCIKCSGVGKVNDKGTLTTCNQCKGTGVLISSPYSTIVVKPNSGSLGESQAPIPPAGYIEKNIEIVKIQDDRIDKHIYKALSAINMEFLVKTPQSESGIAKEVDRDELNNFVYSIAEDIVRILDSVYSIINDMRYMLSITNEDKRRQMLPNIWVPEKYDLLSSNYLLNEIKAAKEAGVNSTIMSALQMEYASKKFNNNKFVKDQLELVYKHDGLSGYTEDEKMSMLSNKGITQEDYIISCNIHWFIKRAQQENENFNELDYEKQREMLLKYTEEIETSTNENNKVIEGING